MTNKTNRRARISISTITMNVQQLANNQIKTDRFVVTTEIDDKQHSSLIICSLERNQPIE